MSLRIAFRSLLQHRLRSLLSVLAIGIGIAAVVCTEGLGASARNQVQQQVDALGEDFLWIRAGSVNAAGVRTGSGGVRTLTASDARALERDVPGIAACSPQIQGRQQIINAGRNWNTRFQGVWPSYFGIRRRGPIAGALFSEDDERRAERVIVLGPSTAEQLFPGENPVGRTVRINRFPFRVIGVLERRGVARGGVDRDDTILLPLSTANQFLDGRTWVSDILCAIHSPSAAAATIDLATTLLRDVHELDDEDPNDFEIQQPVENLEIRARAVSTFSWMLIAIAAVSLLVGGVGIMNIMLVSVIERRREVGIRLAIGARVRDIRRQFLMEAAAIGGLGGLAGIALGWGGAWFLTAVLGWPTLVSADSTAMAVAAAAGAGVVFGYFPAHQASQLDPIEAIQFEQ